jgi:hypothetical protein
LFFAYVPSRSPQRQTGIGWAAIDSLGGAVIAT